MMKQKIQKFCQKSVLINKKITIIYKFKYELEEFMFFGKKQSNVIKLNQNVCNADLEDNQVLFVKLADAVKSADARFEVPSTHDAIVVKGGGDIRYYPSGNYPVFDSKDEIKNWKSGMSVEITYIPKMARVLVKWGTPNRLRYRDEASNKVITVGAHGEFDLSVIVPLQFFQKVVGASREFDVNAFRKRFAETVATEFVDMFLKIVDDKKLTYDKFSANKKEIANEMGKILTGMFEKDWGLSVLNFKIADFDLHDDDMNAIEDAAAKKQRQDMLKEHLAELERLNDKEWEREKYLRQLELQDKMAYYEVLKVVKDRDLTKKEENICPNCKKECAATDKFCPVCGTRVSKEPIICPDCGKANEPLAKFCANCGKKF